MMHLKPVSFAVLFVFTSLSGTHCWAMPLAQQRVAFKQAEKLIAKRSAQQFKQVVVALEGYALLPFLKYQWLRKNLQQTAVVRQFLLDHADSRYSGFLRVKWLKYLAKHKRWKTFSKNYQATTNAQLQCHYYWGQYQLGKKSAAMVGAKKLWVVGVSQPKACDQLFKRLVSSSLFSKKMVWTRFRLALENRKIRLAEYLKRLLNKKQSKTADFWIKVHKNPQLVKSSSDWKHDAAQKGLIFAHGVDRLARTEPVKALNIWDRHKAGFKIDLQRSKRLERRLAIALAFNKNHLAYQRLDQLQDADNTVREWQIRAALNEQNWSHVNTALEYLPETEKSKEKWLYWQGRAYLQTGKKQESRLIFKQLATRRSYYGFLAANALQLGVQLRDHPVLVEQQQIRDLKQLEPFKVVSEFKAIGRSQEAKYNWWYAVNSVTVEGKIIAAKLAEQWGWNQIAIFTIARAKHWDDVKLRFPLIYVEQVQKNAKRQQLDPAIVFGLIRRESAFNQNAMSPVGARGLMQIMPRTGKQIARDLKEKWRSKNILFNPEVNIKYGTFYYKQLLDKYNGHFALAAAAYNAGPHRVKKWLPEKAVVPADIWIETIPFTETREYVAAVLSYALIYQQRMGWNSFKFADFMRDIKPR
jgi:soluble lytic murein transglycosylase